MRKGSRSPYTRALVAIVVACVATMSLPPLPAAAADDIAVSPTSHDFGNVAVGQSSTVLISVTNTGTTTLVISADAAAPFSATRGTCPSGDTGGLVPGQSCSVFAKFAPTTTGSFSGTVFVLYRALGGDVYSSRSVPVTGTGVPARTVTLFPTCGPAAPAKTTVKAGVAGFTPGGGLGVGPVLFEVLDASGAFLLRDGHPVLATGGFVAYFEMKQGAGTYTVRATQDNDGDRVADADEPSASATFTVPCGDGSGGDPAPASHQALLYALMRPISIESGSAPTAIEIVRLADMQRLATLALGNRNAQAFAVSKDGARAYVADAASPGVVAVIDLSNGQQLGSMPAPDPRDVVLSPDGAVLYVTAGTKLIAFGAATYGQLRELTASAADVNGLGSLAVSPNGATLATLGHDGSTSWVYVVRASDLALLARIALTNPGEPTNCATAPNDVAFANDSTLLLWDSNCDNLYEVQVTTLSQNTAATIRMGRDSGSSFNYNNALAYSSATNTAYVHTEGIGVDGNSQGHIGILDRSSSSSAGVFGLGGTPFASAVTPNGASVFVDVIQRFRAIGTRDRLDRFDTLSKKYYSGVYVFSDATMSARDMKILPASADLQITKTDSPDPVSGGGALRYTLTVTNNGPASATNVNVTDLLPPDVSLDAVSDPRGECAVLTRPFLGLRSPITVGSGPERVEFDRERGVAFVSNRNDGTVSFIDLANDVPLGSVAVGPQPTWMAYDPASHRLYISLFGSGGRDAPGTGQGVAVVDTDTRTLVTTLPVGGRPLGMALVPALGRLYVALYRSDAGADLNQVAVITTGEAPAVMRHLTVGFGPGAFGIRYDPELGKIFVPNTSQGSVSVIHVADDSVTTPIFGVGNGGTAIDPVGHRFFLGDTSSPTVWVIDGVTESVLTTFIAGGTNGMAYSIASKRLFVASATLRVFDASGSSYPLLRDIEFFTRVLDVAPLAPARRIYVSLADAGAIRRIDDLDQVELQCPIGTLAAGATVQITVDVTAPNADALMQNNAMVTSDTFDPIAANNIASASTTVQTLPSWPGGAQLTASRLGPRLVVFSWPAVPGVTGYKVYANGIQRGSTLSSTTTSFRAGTLDPNTAYTFTVHACGTSGCTPGPSLAITTPIGYGNYTWSRAYTLTPGVAVDEHLFLGGLSEWFKFTVRPDEQVEVDLTGLPADYDLLMFRDIARANTAPATTQDLRRQSAQLLDSGLIDSGLIDSGLIDSGLIDSGLIDSGLIDSGLIDSGLIDSGLIDSGLIDSGLIDSGLIDSGLIDSGLIDSGLIDSGLIDSGLIDSGLIDSGLIDSGLISNYLVEDSFSSAVRRSLLAASARSGTASERIVRFTFDQSGDYYVRVRGRGGVFDTASPYRIKVQITPGQCETIVPIVTAPGATVLSGSSGGYKRVVVWDRSRMAGTADEKIALAAKLAAYAARPEVAGVLVQADLDDRVRLAHAQADGSPACPYGENVVAAEIKRIIDSYRAVNPIEDVILVGSDRAIPFWRMVDPKLASERGYVPPVQPLSPSQAALQKSLFLTQDPYGALYTIDRLNYSLPLQDIGVSRVIETAAEVTAQLDAYALLNGGLVPLPATASALITGYDFLKDFAAEVQGELVPGLGSGGSVDASLNNDTWTMAQLRAKLLTTRYDLLSIGGHFSAFSTTAADYDAKTKLSSTEVLASNVNMTWSIVATPGCHAGYNVPDADAIFGVTPEPDWAQVAARKGFILVSGTGYQIGETEIVDYSERLYVEFWKALRGVSGSGAISTSAALLEAKTAYRARPLSDPLHIKALLEATHFGLPVLVNIPVKRQGAGDASIVTSTTPYAAGPGASLGLSSADTGTLSFSLTTHTLPVLIAGTEAETNATYLSGGNGVVSNTLEPILPLELRNVTAPTSAVLRGVGFRGGTYADTSGVLALTATPGTELGAPMVPFGSEVLYPVRPWGANATETLSGGPVRLYVTPAQHRTDPAQPSRLIRRRIDTAAFRLFYSTLTGANAAVGAHEINEVSSTLGPNGATFQVVVSGDPAVGAQEVWVTYTTGNGTWTSIDLARSSIGPFPGRETWTGTLGLSGVSAADVTYFVQVANGAGIVSMRTNNGAYYRFVQAQAPAQAATAITVSAPPSGAYGNEITATATLTSNGQALQNANVTFDLGGLRAHATTGANGVATAQLLLRHQPGLTYELRASFDGSATLAPSESASAPVAITRQGSAISLSATSISGRYSNAATPIVTATLRDLSTGALPIREETIYWVVSGPDLSGTPRYYATTDITSAAGEAILRIDAVPLPAGTYGVTAYFNGAIPQPAGPALVLSSALYEPSTATASMTVTAETASVAYTGATTIAAGSTLNAAATVAQANDGAPGDITKARVRFDVRDGATVVATATVPVSATGEAASAFAGLAASVYTVEATVVGGFFTGAISALVAVYDPTGGFVTGGGWIDSGGAKANFGFNAKYDSGATTPKGQTELKSGTLSFKSTSYDWLVVSGARAQYRGSGAVNGKAGYSFMLTVIDGSPDRFRIRIWETATGVVVYDNEPGAADDADPTTVIKGGSIVIHKG